MKIVRTRMGARVEQDGLILSEIRSTPGATDSLFDVLAVCISALVPGTRVAMLGFAGGGIVAPLRASGFGHPFDAVDLSLELVPLYRELSVPWGGDVRLHEADAVAWLRGSPTRFDLIMEDISARVDGEITKPPVSLTDLPALMATRLRPGGIVVTNVLPVPGWPMSALLAHLAAPHAQARFVRMEAWENHILIAGEKLPKAREMSRALKGALRAIDSTEAEGLSVRTLR